MVRRVSAIMQKPTYPGPARRATPSPTSTPTAQCTVPGCARPSAKAAARGLSVVLCRYHTKAKARHGSAWRRSYRAAELDPYLRAARSVIGVYCRDLYIAHALTALDASLQGAGEAVPATRTRWLKPRDKAKAVLARLREKGVSATRLLAVYLAVAAVIEEDDHAPRSEEFRQVQVAKPVLRMASGYHGRWERELRDGRTVQHELHKYTQSSGLMLRHLGMMIEECCEHVVTHRLGTVLALKVKRYGKLQQLSRGASMLPGRGTPVLAHGNRRQGHRVVRTVKAPDGMTLKRVITYD